MDVAWSYLLRNTPMMANPHEYRQTLWEVLHDGKLSDEMQAKVDANRPKDAPASKRDLDAMNDIVRQARILRGEDPDAPDERPVQILDDV